MVYISAKKAALKSGHTRTSMGATFYINVFIVSRGRNTVSACQRALLGAPPISREYDISIRPWVFVFKNMLVNKGR